MNAWKIKGWSAAILSIFVLSFIVFHTDEYARISSPDGKYIAVAEYRSYLALIPMTPGSSGDKEGWITIKTKDGRKIGKEKVEMVSFINDIRWSATEASIPAVATWNLEK